MKLLLTIILALTALTTWLGYKVYDIEYYKWAEGHRIPECQEDAVLIGAGQFEHGVWDYYQCGPSVDDYNN